MTDRRRASYKWIGIEAREYKAGKILHCASLSWSVSERARCHTRPIRYAWITKSGSGSCCGTLFTLNQTIYRSRDVHGPKLWICNRVYDESNGYVGIACFQASVLSSIRCVVWIMLGVTMCTRTRFWRIFKDDGLACRRFLWLLKLIKHEESTPLFTRYLLRVYGRQ